MSVLNKSNNKNNEDLQIQYDSYIAKKLQEEERLRYEKWKKIEEDDFEFAKKLQEEEERKFQNSQNPQNNSEFSNLVDSYVDLTGTNRLSDNDNNKNANKRKLMDISNKESDISPKKKQRQEISSNKEINIKKEIPKFSKKIISENSGNDKLEIKKEVNVKSDTKSFNKNAISNFNLNHQPKKEISGSNLLADVKLDLLNKKTKKIIELEKNKKINDTNNTNKTNAINNDYSNVHNKSLIKKDNDNTILNSNKNKLLSNKDNNNSLVKNKVIINNDNINRLLLEQLQQEEVIFNSLSDNPFLPPKKKQTIALDNVQSIILEQERLLQEYNRKRKGKEKDTNEKSVILKGAINSNINNNKKNEMALKKFNVRNISELDDPCPDLHQLFLLFNAQYFHHKLDSVEVRWSKRMTLCAGICYYYPGGYCSVRLSEPLLKFRTRDDFINTLLHEMIHAYLFLTEGNKDHDGHGESFHRMMYKLNKETGSNITVYHNFHNEVNHYRTHVWRCNGPCRFRPPFFGYVRRSMNRKPQKADSWWRQHQATCGGEFIKISEPEEYTKKKLKKKGATVDSTVLNQASTSNIESFNRLKNINTIVNKNKTKKLDSPAKPNNNIFTFNNIKNKNKNNNNNNNINSITPLNTLNNLKKNGSNIYGFKNLGKKENDNNKISTIKSNGSNIHGFTNLGNSNKSKIKTISNINTGRNVHGFTNLGNSGSNTTNTTRSNIKSNIHGFNNLRNNTIDTNNKIVKKKTRSIYDLLKKKK